MKNFAHLKKESPFYPAFNGGLVPIINILVPGKAECLGDGVQEVYMVDLEKLTPAQFHAVAKMVRDQCDPSIPLETAMEEMKTRGLPLRAKHVASVSTNSLAFL